ncbi:uncharacterized protein PAC_13181 [Phialocephala subalpina]|uniref:DUF6594 domain-containing protein n=1 Tax=Phialocephala subalpina TaxID=576137 RepID=A0A1L7XE28_9HELO|nr:uncharacterized protein PAC_13181 [Phialocephala subalpina]
MSSTPPSSTGIQIKPTKEEIKKQPWKYTGYRGYSSWVASSDTFFHVRKFATLNARVILQLQDDICVLEEKLQILDEIYSSKESGIINNGSFRDDKQMERVETMNDLKQKLLEYNSFINSHTPLRARPAVPKEDSNNSYAWHYNNHGAILDEEQAYLTHEDDLMAIRPQEKGSLRRFIGRFALARRHGFFRRNPDGTENFQDPETHYLARLDRIDKLVSGIILLAGLLMLVVPLWILEFVTDEVVRLGVITTFVVLFLVVVVTISGAKPYESLAATAAYAAVLIVFLALGKPGP